MCLSKVVAPGQWSFADWFENNKGTGIAILVAVAMGIVFVVSLSVYLCYMVCYRRLMEAVHEHTRKSEAADVAATAQTAVVGARGRRGVVGLAGQAAGRGGWAM